MKKSDTQSAESGITLDDEEEWQELISVARAIIAGEIEFFPGILLLWGSACHLGVQEHSPFFPTIAFAVSASDDLPLDADFRKLCASSFLEKKDRQRVELEDFYRDEVVNACQEILAQYEQTHCSE